VPNARDVHARLLDRGFIAGLALGEWYPDDAALADALLVCATEVTTPDQIAAFVEALAEVAR
jgi:glycine dehydrogenase subunit 1